MQTRWDGLVTPIRLEEGRGLVKTLYSSALSPLSFENARAAVERAGEIGVGPHLRLADAGTLTLLMADVSDTHHLARTKDLKQPAILAKVVALKRRWHRDGVGANLSPFEIFTAVVSSLKARGSPLPMPPSIDLTWNKIIDMTAQVEGAITASGVDLAVAHGQNTAYNVLIGPNGSILLADFDRACRADPLWDIAALALEIAADNAGRNLLLELYLGRSSKETLARLKLYGLVDDALGAAWALAGDLDTERKGSELYKRAANRLIRIEHCLRVFDLDALLRRV